MKTIILIAGLLSAIIVYSQGNSDKGKFMKYLTIEADIGYFKAFAPDEIQDFMEARGLYLSGGGGWFGTPWRSYPRVYDEHELTALFMLGYELNNQFETGLFFNFGDKAKVSGGYNGKYIINTTCEDFMLGAYFRYHISNFEFQAGPSFQFVTTKTSYAQETNVAVNRQTLPGISGGLNLEIPKRHSAFDFIIGFKYNYFFNNIDIGQYELSTTDIYGTPISYTLPGFEVNANSYFIYVGLRANIQNFGKKNR